MLFCFPTTKEVDATSMNYASVVVFFFSLFASIWYFAHARHHYRVRIIIFCARICSLRRTIMWLTAFFHRSSSLSYLDPQGPDLSTVQPVAVD